MNLRILLFVATVLAAGTAPAATFVVTSSADTAETSCGSVCTLRQAIIAANASMAFGSSAMSVCRAALGPATNTATLAKITS